MRRLKMALVVLMSLAPGCAGPGIPQGADPGTLPPPVELRPATTPASGQILTLERLRNTAYPLPEANGNLIQFTDGKFRGPVVLGSTEELRFTLLDRVGRGDLDGDGVEDVALLMIKDPTGDKPEYTLWAVINQGGAPDPRGVVLLGEEVQVGGMIIEDLKIFLDVVRPGPQDIVGMPTRRIKESYKLLGNRLERADTFR
jgi:hypothetical protein